MSAATTPPFVGTAGLDSFVGSTLLNLFQFTPFTLEAADSVAGNTNPAALDQVVLVAGGAVAAASWLGVTNVEALTLSDADNVVTLSDALVGGSDAGFFAVLDAAGPASSTVDASSVGAGRTVHFSAQSGDDRFIGGAGNDSLQIAAADLTAADTFLAGAGGNWLTITGAGAVAADAFAHIKDIDILQVTGGASVALANGMFGDGATVYGSAGNDTIDASAVSDRGIAFLSGAGDDRLIGSSRGDYYHFATAADLTAEDVIDAGDGDDTVVLYGGVAQADALSHTSSVELFVLSGAAQFTLLDTVSARGIVVETSGYGDIVDGHLLATNALLAYVNDGSYAIRGGAQDDAFWLRADTLDRDALHGGGGHDYIVMEGPAELTTSDLQFVAEVEEIQLRSGGSVAIADVNVSSASGHRVVLAGSAAADVLDASALVDAANSVTLRSAGGPDILKGGAGNDVIGVLDGSYAQVDGSGGFDILQLIADDGFWDLAEVAGKTDHIEAVDMRGAGVNALTLTGELLAAVTNGGDVLYVLGDFDDEVDIGADWNLVETNQTNANLPGLTFNHFEANGHHLYLQDTFAGGIILWNASPDLFVL